MSIQHTSNIWILNDCLFNPQCPPLATRNRRKLKKAQTQPSNFTPFRVVERSFKHVPSVTLDHVFDPQQPYHTIPSHPNTKLTTHVLHNINPQSISPLFKPSNTNTTKCNCLHTRSLTLITINSIPGLIIVPNILTHTSQKHLIKKCLQEYTKRPNLSNLDTHYEVPNDVGLWELAERVWKGNLTKDHGEFWLKPRQGLPKSYQDVDSKATSKQFHDSTSGNSYKTCVGIAGNSIGGVNGRLCDFLR